MEWFGTSILWGRTSPVTGDVSFVVSQAAMKERSNVLPQAQTTGSRMTSMEMGQCQDARAATGSAATGGGRAAPGRSRAAATAQRMRRRGPVGTPICT